MNAPHHPLVTLGYHDALRGHTACPFGLRDQCRLWAEGYDLAFDNGEAELPRFGRIQRCRNGVCKKR